MKEDIEQVLKLGGTRIVFGALHEDGTVNEEMLQEVGLGVAMQNASPQVAAIADDHTLDNNHAGVLAYLEKIFG